MAKRGKAKAKAKGRNVAKAKIESNPSSDASTQSVDESMLCSDEETPEKHYQPHDKFVKRAFEDIEIAQDFFALYLKDPEGEQEDKDLELKPEDFANFEPSPAEHMRSWQTKIISDVIYHGTIRGQHYYINLEHQSSHDKTMFARF